ncbi:MAG: flippase [Verrucomicrobiota bacterium]
MAKNVASNYFGFAVTTLVLLLLMPFLVRKLGSVGFGIWTLLNTLMAYCQLLELGIIPAVIRYVSSHHARDERKEIESVVVSAAVLLGLIGLLTVPIIYLVALFAPDLFDVEEANRELFVHGIWLIGLAGILGYFRRMFQAVFEGFQRYVLLNLCAISSCLLAAAFTVYFVLKGGGVIALIWILIGQILFEVVLMLILMRRALKLGLHPARTSRESMRKIVSYSFFAFLMDAADTISYRIDHVVIGIFLPLSEITFYTIALRIATVLERVTAPVIGTFFPLASALHSSAKPESLRQLFLEGTRVSVMIITPGMILGYAYGADVIGWLVGAEYVARSGPVLYLLLGAVFLTVFEWTSVQILLGTGRMRFNAGVKLAAALSNLTLSLILVRNHGIVGVAIGTLIPIAVFSLFVTVPYTCALTKTSVLKGYIFILGPGLLLTAIALPLIFFTTSWMPNRFIGCVVHSALVLAITAFLFWRVFEHAMKGREHEVEAGR